MELVLYYIKESSNLLISFLILMFLVGIVCFLAIRNFRQDRKGKIIFYGLLLKMNNIDILKLSTVLIKAFLVVYGSIVTKQSQVFMSIIMMIIVTMIYVLCSPKRIIYEVSLTAVQVMIVYFIFLVNNYSVEVENTMVILVIKIFLIIFILMLTTYLFFREIDIISKNRADKRFLKEEREAEL